MVTIGIELNHVLRNINKQFLKYYSKEFDSSVEWEDVDYDKEEVSSVLEFNSTKDRLRFIYTDYPYEIFGCAEVCERNLASKFNEFLLNLDEMEDKDVRVVLYSLEEGGVSLQSTYFFLSKCGIRCREMFFPKSIGEVWDRCDVVVTANKDVVMSKPDGDKRAVLIRRPWNYGCKDEAYKSYDHLSELLEDNNFIEKL